MLFVNIRSIQEEFSGFVKQVKTLIRLSRKDSICGSSILTSKSPNNELNINLSFSLTYLNVWRCRFVWVTRTTDKPFLFMKIKFEEKKLLRVSLQKVKSLLGHLLL